MAAFVSSVYGVCMYRRLSIQRATEKRDQLDLANVKKN